MRYALASILILSLAWLHLRIRKLRATEKYYWLAGRKMRLRIEAFTGYGWSNGFRVAGRVSKDGGRLSALDGEFERMGFAKKFRRNFRRFMLPEMAGIALEVRVAGQLRETTSGANGRFNVLFDRQPPLTPGIHPYSVRLHEGESGYEAFKTVGQIIVPTEKTEIGIISDIDDTIVVSYIKNRWRMLLNTAVTSVSDLQPTPGMATLLLEAAVGRSRQEANPVFYVSGSPVNLQDKLNAFLRANRFPPGPIFLTSIGRDAGSGFFQQRIFKTERIRELFTTYPKLKFILIGDNGQWDSTIYQQIDAEFPGRVAATLIYERIPKLESGKILPLGQHPITNALEGGIILYRRHLICRDGLQSIANDLILREVLPESFNLNKYLKQSEQNARENVIALKRQ